MLVDYAHTDDALRNVLTALRAVVPASGRLTVLFGCGGDRDRSKRPRMAQAAAELADRIIVTSDNPRTENPDSIIDEIVAGFPPSAAHRVERERDRALAIALAVQGAREGEVIVLAGKGHEDYQIIGREKHPFDDRLVAARAMRQAGGGA